MSKTQNQFVWYDLNTTDKAGAKAFYSELFGWTIEDTDMGEAGTYTGLQNGEAGFGGIDEARGGAPAHWLGYIEVDDVDARMARLEQLGGSAMMPGFNIPGVGRIAVLTDPSGAALALYKGSKDNGDWEPSKDKTGDIGWAEVSATDLQKAKGFYGEGFGWATNTMPMPNGEYNMLMVGDKAIGGLYEKPAEMPVCAWIFYVNVDDVPTTVAKAKFLGASVMVEEQIPRMVHFALMADPQGAVIGVAKSLAE